MNPYTKFVSAFARLLADGKKLPLGNIPSHGRSAPGPDAPNVLIFSPHPDDECIMGGLPLRLAREAGFCVVNVAVTLGSNRERQQARLSELKAACEWLGFELEQTGPSGLEAIYPATRRSNPARWFDAARVISDCLLRYQPRAIFFPHASDWNSTHVGTHLLVLDALKNLPESFECRVVETEFWAQMPDPNLMVELGVEEVADLLAALSFHRGEVLRNAYHLRLPGWLMDNVRRGAEWIGGQGAAAPGFPFAVLCRARKWQRGRMDELFQGGKILPLQDSPRAALQL
jgi:N-acetylglucosamine malate deacetylase 1